MGAQRLVAACLVDPGIVIEIAERRREAVGTMLERHATEREERVLQANRQCGETLSAEHRFGMLPGRIGQHEVIQPMVQRLAGNADAGIGHVGEIRQRLLSGNMVLTEDHLAIGTVLRAPGTNPAFQATAKPIPVMIGMAALHLFEHRDRPQAGTRLEQRADVAVP